MTHIELLYLNEDKWENDMQDVFSSISDKDKFHQKISHQEGRLLRKILIEVKNLSDNLNFFNYQCEIENFTDEGKTRVLVEKFELPEKIENLSNEGSKYLIEKFKHSKLLSQSSPALDEEKNITAISMKEHTSTTVVFQSDQWVHVSISKHGKHKAMLTAKIYLSEQEKPCAYLDKLARLFENE